MMKTSKLGTQRLGSAARRIERERMSTRGLMRRFGNLGLLATFNPHKPHVVHMEQMWKFPRALHCRIVELLS
jgi:hypothetical protein